MSEPAESRKKNYRALYRREQKAFRNLNDRVIESYLVVRALSVVAQQMDDGRLFKEPAINISVPSHETKRAGIKRDKQFFNALIKSCAEKGEYSKSLVLCVSEAEDYVASVLRLILRAYPERLTISIKGNEGKIQIDLDQIIAAKRLDDIIEDRIRARIQQAIYAAPRQYLQYLNAVIRQKIPDTLIEKFCEVKATRGILVHAQGVANEAYREKSGVLARAKIGEDLPINKTYFDKAVSVIKDVYKAINRAVLEQYGDDPRLAAILREQASDPPLL